MPNTVQVQLRCAHPRPRTHVKSVHRSDCPCQTLYTYTYSVHVQAHGRTYNTRIAQAAHVKHCTRAGSLSDARIVRKAVYLYVHTVRVRVQCARPSTWAYVRYAHRAGYPCRTYTYSVHVQAHGLTYNRRIAQAAHAEHCTCTRTGCTPTRSYSRAIGAPLYKYKYSVHAHVHVPTYNKGIAQASFRLSMANTVHVQIQALTYTRRTAWAAHTEHCKNTSTVCTPTFTHPRTMGAPFRLSMPNTVQVQIQCSRPRPRPRTHAQ